MARCFLRWWREGEVVEGWGRQALRRAAGDADRIGLESVCHHQL
jgi:hypothetical protein